MIWIWDLIVYGGPALLAGSILAVLEVRYFNRDWLPRPWWNPFRW